MRFFDNFKKFLKFEWMICPKDMTCLNHFRVSAPRSIATWGWHPLFERRPFTIKRKRRIIYLERFASQSSLVFCSHAGAPPNKKSGENRKYQPLNTKSRIDSSGSLLPADPSKPTRPRCICVVTGPWCRFCCVVWCWQHQLLRAPSASECKLPCIICI